MSSGKKQKGQTVGQAKPVLAYYKATLNNTLSERKTSGVNAIPNWALNTKHKGMISLLIAIATSMPLKTERPEDCKNEVGPSCLN